MYTRNFKIMSSRLLLGLLLITSGFSAQASESLQNKPVTPRELSSLFVDVTNAGDRLVAVGQHGHIIYSDDNGASWLWANSPVNSLLTAVYFVSDQVGWAVGHDGMILHSQDSGQSWSIQYNGLALATDSGQKRVIETQARLKNAESLLLAARAEGNNSIDLEFSRDDAKVALELALDAIDQPEADPFMDIWFEDQQHGIAVGAFGLIKRTEDGGKHWQDWSAQADNEEGLHYYAMTANSNGQLLLAGEAGTLLRSSDAGRHWEPLESPYDGSFFGVTAFHDNPQRVIAYGLRGNIYLSNDFGSHWAQLNSGTNASLFSATQLHNGKLLLVGDAGYQVTTDGDSTQTTQHPSRQPMLSIIETNNDALLAFGPVGVVDLPRTSQELK